jgi:thymidylate synthase
MVEVMQPYITYPDFGPTSQIFGDDFAKGLIDPDIAEEMAFKFDYSYGGRIHGLNALSNCIEMLKLNYDTRRAVLTIYNRADLADSLTGKEVPCATQIYLGIDDGKLTMTLMMRSNDVVGAFPADAYGFRRLQEYIAGEVGVEIGVYRHYIENAHIIEHAAQDWIEKQSRRLQE